MQTYDRNDPEDPLVEELRTLFAQVDPVPPLVTQTAKASLGWRRLDADLAELLSDSTLEAEALTGARGTGAPVRAVSFGAGAVTIEIDIHTDGAHRRLLGQLSPPAIATIEIRTVDDTTAAAVESDSLGRFRTQLPAGGPIRLHVVTKDPHSSPPIETSWITI
jgi:hypothetical protein